MRVKLRNFRFNITQITNFELSILRKNLDQAVKTSKDLIEIYKARTPITLKNENLHNERNTHNHLSELAQELESPKKLTITKKINNHKKN
jgi:hypothetical protein